GRVPLGVIYPSNKYVKRDEARDEGTDDRQVLEIFKHYQSKI
ncbi:unnamed protein product, partial [marine sediment metagenome]